MSITFKNALIYRLTKPLHQSLGDQELEGLLSEYEFRSCGEQDAASV